MAELTKSELAGKLWVAAKVPRRYWPRRLEETLNDPRGSRDLKDIWGLLQFAVEHGLPHILRFDEWDDRLMQLHAEIVRAACVKGKSGLFCLEPWLGGDGFKGEAETADVLVVVARCSPERQWAAGVAGSRLCHLIDKRYWENKATLVLHDASVDIGQQQLADRVNGYHAQHATPDEAPPPAVRSALEVEDAPEEPVAVTPRALKVKARKARRPKKEAKADEGS